MPNPPSSQLPSRALRSTHPGGRALDRVRREYETAGIGPVLLDLIRTAFERVRVPVGAGGDRDDLVQGFIAEDLLRDRQLEYVMREARNDDHLHRLLGMRIGRWMGDQRARTVVGNVIGRCDDAATQWPLRVVAMEPRTKKRFAAYCFHDCACDARPVLPAEEARAVRDARLLPVEFGGGGDTRLPRVYAPEVLPLLLVAVRSALPCGVRRDVLRDVLRFLLADWTAGRLVEFSEASDAASPEATPEARIEATEVGWQFVADLAPRDRVVLRGYLDGVPDGETAAHLGVARTTVIARRNRVTDSLAALVDHGDVVHARELVQEIDRLLTEDALVG